MIMRSLKQHVGLLPDDIFWGPKLSKSLSCVASFDSAQPLSSYHIDTLASRLSPDTKDICRDNSTTVGAHRGARARWCWVLEGIFLKVSGSLWLVRWRKDGLIIKIMIKFGVYSAKFWDQENKGFYCLSRQTWQDPSKPQLHQIRDGRG